MPVAYIRDASWRDVYVYFNNDGGGAAVRDATRLRGLLVGESAL